MDFKKILGLISAFMVAACSAEAGTCRNAPQPRAPGTMAAEFERFRSVGCGDMSTNESYRATMRTMPPELVAWMIDRHERHVAKRVVETDENRGDHARRGKQWLRFLAYSEDPAAIEYLKDVATRGDDHGRQAVRNLGYVRRGDVTDFLDEIANDPILDEDDRREARGAARRSLR